MGDGQSEKALKVLAAGVVKQKEIEVNFGIPEELVPFGEEKETLRWTGEFCGEAVERVQFIEEACRQGELGLVIDDLVTRKVSGDGSDDSGLYPVLKEVVKEKFFQRGESSFSKARVLAGLLEKDYSEAILA